MSDRKLEGLFVPDIHMPESCIACPVKKYLRETGDVFCFSLNRIVGNCAFDNDEGYVGEVCTSRHKDCRLKECFFTQVRGY